MRCPSCGEGEVKPFLSYGKLPLGNAFLRSEEVQSEETFSLELGFCGNCQLVQQVNPAPTENLRRVYERYPYVPVGNTLTRHLSDLGHSLVQELHLSKDSLVMDIGSNDGSLLSSMRQQCRVLGIEPAPHIAKTAIQRGVETIVDFFDRKVAERILDEYGQADLVVTTQTMQHIPQLSSFMQNVVSLMKPEGFYVTEGRYLADTMKKVSFDSIYHEMLYVFHLGSLMNLFRRVGLRIFKARQVDVYGGSLRVFARNTSSSSMSIDSSVTDVSGDEEHLGLGQYETYRSFAEKVLKTREELNSVIVKIKVEGKTIAAYGAPSTGTTLLNFCGIGRDQIDYIVDDNPLKQGLLQPGTHIPIVDSTVLSKDMPDYLFILAWRLKDEILEKVKTHRERGMKIIIPLPTVDVLS